MSNIFLNIFRKTVIIFFLLSSSLFAADETIEMLNKQGKESMVYSKKL